MVPGLHLLELQEVREALEDLIWIGAGRAVEARVLKDLPERLQPIPFEKLDLALEPKGGGAPSRAALALRSLPATMEARRALKRHRSQLLLALGGFTTLPAVLAARSLGLKVCLLEVNAVPGAATRYLAPLAQRVLHSWNSPKLSEDGKERHIGPPLSPAYAEGMDSAAAMEKLGLDPKAPLLAVLGGSQGAGGINSYMASEAPKFLRAGIQIVHQVGPGRLEEGFQGDGEARAGYHCTEYVKDVRSVLAAASVVLCRGGASTLAEVGAARVPAIVVPFPHHRDQHQRVNAQQLGAGVEIVDQSELGPEWTARCLELLSPDGAHERERMSRAQAECVPRDGARRLFEQLQLL